MKKFKDISEFEDLLKDNLQGHSTPAPPDVWSSVAASTSQSAGILSQATHFLSSTTNLLKVALFAGGIAAVGIVIYNENKPTEQIEAPTITETTPNTIPSKDDVYKREQSASEEKIETVKTEKQGTKREITAILQSKIDSKQESATKLSEQKSDFTKATSTTQTDKSISDKKISPTGSSFNISNTKPCKGELVTISQSDKTDWSIDDKVVANNVREHTFKVNQEGLYAISNGKVSKTIEVSHLDLNITLRETERGHFTASLPTALIANWYLDDKLIATNETKVNIKTLEVGEHKVRTTVVNHTCNTTVTNLITLQPIGSITFYTIFTPDGDGKNDEYKVDISEYDNYSIQIYNKQNQRVFISQSPENKWNGKIYNQGEECANGEYYAKISYQLKGEYPQVENIRITLKR